MQIIKKGFTLVVLFLIYNSGIRTQTTTLRKYSDALISDLQKEDYASYVKKIYPSIVDMAGGQESFAKNTKEIREAFKQGGFVYEKYEYASNTEAVKAGEELHAIVSYKTTLSIEKNKFKGILYFLAISKDGGKSWTFVDLETFDKQSIKDFIPNYNEDLPFPEITYPEPVTDK